MHNTIKNLIYIENLIKSKTNHDKLPKIIAVTKTFPIENILPLIEHGQLHYGENKVQEALDKWSNIKSQNNNIKLHLIGKLQTNKVKDQKSGINIEKVQKFYNFCKKINLDIIGTMCIPPNDEKTINYFSEMNQINQELNFKELSMGMSSDYLEAVQNNATYIRVGSKIFGGRG